MNKKIIIFGMVMLGFIALVIAQGGIGEGDIITQEQLDSIDALTIDLQCQFEDIGEDHFIQDQGHWFYFRNISCLSIKPIPIDEHTNEYLIIRPSYYPNFLVSDYFYCTEENDRDYCDAFYTNVLIEQHESNVKAIREKIIKFQSIGGDYDYSDFEDGFGL